MHQRRPGQEGKLSRPDLQEASLMMPIRFLQLRHPEFFESLEAKRRASDPPHHHQLGGGCRSY